MGGIKRNLMDDNLIKEMLEYRESLYKQLTVINGILGDESYRRIVVYGGLCEKYGVETGYYVCSTQTLKTAINECVAEAENDGL